MNCARCGTSLPEGSSICSHCGALLAARRDPPLLPSGYTPTPGGSIFRPPGTSDDLDLLPIKSGTILEGRYTIETKLGTGGMGSVYQAHEIALDRRVAIKVLSSSLAGNPDAVARFEREARVTAGLDHPNIVPIYAVGKHGAAPFLVMKLMTGVTLAQKLRDLGRIPPPLALHYASQAASGLDYIHQRKLVHRDIKTGNLMVGPDDHLTILDFGVLRDTSRKSAITQAGVMVGTPTYASPEQARDSAQVDWRADLYALGVVLFEMLTGRRPFESDSPYEVLRQHQKEEPPDPADVAPIAPALGAVVRLALSKDPSKRYQSGAALVAALETAIKSTAAEGRTVVQAVPIPPAARAPEVAEPEAPKPVEEPLSSDPQGPTTDPSAYDPQGPVRRRGERDAQPQPFPQMVPPSGPVFAAPSLSPSGVDPRPARGRPSSPQIRVERTAGAAPWIILTASLSLVVGLAVVHRNRKRALEASQDSAPVSGETTEIKSPATPAKPSPEPAPPPMFSREVGATADRDYSREEYTQALSTLEAQGLPPYGGPAGPRAEFVRAMCLLRVNRNTEAMSALQAFQDAHPDSPDAAEAWLGRAQASLNLGFTAQALALLSSLINSHPPERVLQEALALRGETELAGGNPDGGIADLERVAQTAGFPNLQARARRALVEAGVIKRPGSR